MPQSCVDGADYEDENEDDVDDDDGWKEEWMDRWLVGWMNEWKDGWIDGWMKRCMNEWWKDDWMHGWLDGWMMMIMMVMMMGFDGWRCWWWWFSWLTLGLPLGAHWVVTLCRRFPLALCFHFIDQALVRGLNLFQNNLHKLMTGVNNLLVSAITGTMFSSLDPHDGPGS